MKKNRLIITGIVVIAVIAAAFALLKHARDTEPVEAERTAWLEGPLIVHRGIHDDQLLPENSIAAFAAAIANGNPIELDVSLTRDGQVVVFHDKKLKRVFGADTWLQDITYAELSQYTLASTAETVPPFSEVLAFVDGLVPLLIEIKNEGEVGILESMVYDQLRTYKGEYAIQAFNPYSVKWFRDHAPEVLRGQLAGSFIVTDYEVEYQGTTRLPWYKSLLLSNLLMNFASQPNFIAYETENVDSNTLKGLRKLDVPVLGWTIDDQAEYDSVKPYFDNFISNTTTIER